MRMMQFTPKFPSTFVRSRLGLAVASSLMLAAMGTANAVDVGPGQTVTITPGSAFEGQNLSVHGGTANVLGARMGALDSFSAGGTHQTIINADGAGFTSTTGNFVRSSTAVFRNSVLSATTGPALGLARSGAVDGNGRPYPRVSLIDSSLTSTRIGLQVLAGGYADVDGSTISGGTYGVSVGAGSVSLRNGSTVNGATAGILIISSPTIEENLADWGVMVDGSHVEASNGSAILFGAHLPSVSRPDTLLIQNDATLVGSNGVIISTRDNAHFDLTARTSTLKGDITIADTASGTLRFLDGLDLTGRILGPADVIVDQGGRWTLSGDSNTGNLTLGAGSNIFLGAAGTA
ncbi:autotransporter outer membrane beta-barrel domain-containing protein, partial [Stenotrophomonas maltophilia]|nr:autotransporter outer membrane beta-barrel domain-containing protein [Stenotrophomonas maltophilia]